MFSTITRIALAALLAVNVSGVSAAAAETPVKIRGGVAVYFEGMLAVLAAQEKGYFKAENIDLELVDFQGGGPTVQAFVGGSADMCFCAGDHVVRLRSKHIPAVVLYGLDDLHDYTLIGKRDGAASGGLAAMKGKPLGITSPGSMTDNTLRWAISGLKLNPDSDFQIVSSGTGASMLASIESGKVDAGMVVATDREFLLQKKDTYRIVEDFTALPYAGFSAIVLESWVAAHPDAARGFVRALEHATADLRSDPTLGVKIVKAAIYPHLSDDLVAVAAKSAIMRIPAKGQYSAEAVKNLNDIMISADPSLKPVTVDAMRPKL